MVVSHSLPSPPADEHKSGLSRKGTSSSSKSAKSANRVSKRANSNSAVAVAVHHHDHVTNGAGMDGRHKRVWKACERCRMKKTKCDGEFPCKRCKDDGMVCTAGVRKKVEYKQLPKGYAEVLEHTQFALIATVVKLYSMVRSAQPWDLGEPELNDRGQPVIHNIAQKLGCIRPNSDIDLPVHSVFPEDEAGMAELARQLEEQQALEGEAQGGSSGHGHKGTASSNRGDTDSSIYGRADRASSSELDHSDSEQDYRRLPQQDYRRQAFGSGSGSGNSLTLSPQSFTGTTISTDFEFSPTGQDLDTNGLFASQSPQLANFPAWALAKPPNDVTMHFLQQAGLHNPDMLNQGLVEAGFDTIKPDILSCPNPDVMMGMGDPMIYSGFDGESMRL
ncbi:Fluconazole resistance protein 1 [Tolypocladium ophioglossoides CBS 100239]|uniref:Fluconazole resistance protein 1 n=1 Tax=Tolypocladium ophioglossoides (strain CBS 100239) TaxID=1163406 RepID=A0A0L0N050_TOLOC|nr:Fluconazole resistance protein 1 [Tolypocladium ophioglossoides CBS 100239]